MGQRVSRLFSAVTVSVFVATLTLTPPTPSPAQTGLLNGVVVDQDGMHNTRFKTSKGDVIVHLPDDMAAGDTISGTVVTEPAGKTDGERAANGGALSGYVIELGKQSTKAGDKYLRWYLPRASTSAGLTLRDPKRNAVGRVDVPVEPPGGTASPVPILPKLIVIDKPWVVRGLFHPETHDPKVTVGGNPATPLAESPRKIICANPSTQPGPQTITVQETPRDATRNVTAPTPSPVTTGVANVLHIELSAPKTTLRRGETTTLHVAVSGLEGIRAPVPLRIQNQTPKVLQLGGGDDQRALIHSRDVKDGTYVTDRVLTGIQPGSFSIFADVTPAIMRSENASDNTVDDCLKLLKQADDLDAQALKLRQQAADFQDKANAASSEYSLLSGASQQLKTSKTFDIMDERKQVADVFRGQAADADKHGDGASAARLMETADRVEAEAKDVAARMKAAGVSDPPVSGDADRMMTAALAKDKEAKTFNNLADRLTKQADDLNAQANKLRDQAVCKSAA